MLQSAFKSFRAFLVSVFASPRNVPTRCPVKVIPVAILLLITMLIVSVMTYYTGTPLDETAMRCMYVLATMAGVVAAYCFVVGELTDNKSQVDKLWSLVPIAYVWVAASFGEFHIRLVLMSLLVTFWGLRLTYNFSLKGAYQWKFWEGDEDYRWLVLRAKPEFQPRWVWTLFNLVFISGYQNALILMFTLPAVVALQFRDQPLGPLDYVAAVSMFAFIVYELVADWQHWTFQSEKHRRINAGEALDGAFAKGFLDTGLWARSRHPNYFAEQSIWVCFYLFSVAASGQWINWSIAGCLLLIVLFIGSSRFSEEISSEKYPEYAEYKKRVPRFLPYGTGSR